MGMHDRIVDFSLSCPYCGESSNIEVQTSDLERDMSTYHVHVKGEKLNPMVALMYRDDPKISDQLRVVKGTANCSSPLCLYAAKLEQIVSEGYFSGFGRSFDVFYRVKNGNLIGPAKDILYPSRQRSLLGLKKAFLGLMRAENDKRWIETLKRCNGEFSLAILMYRCPRRLSYKWVKRLRGEKK